MEIVRDAACANPSDDGRMEPGPWCPTSPGKFAAAGRSPARRGNVAPPSRAHKGYSTGSAAARAPPIALRAGTTTAGTLGCSASRADPLPRARAVVLRRHPGEAHVPTEQPQAQEDARLPYSDAHPRRASRPTLPARTRPEASLRLIWRVRDRATFAALARAPRHRHGPVSVRFRAGDTTEPPRVAYAVGRRVGSAVVRNRVRRRLRAAVAEHGADLAPGGAYLFERSRRC